MLQVVIVCGTSASGKSSISESLSQILTTQSHSSTYLDADDFHPASNKQKMSNGIPLTDEDRFPWLNSICEHITSLSTSQPQLKFVILACSALKKIYRDQFRTIKSDSINVKFACLIVPYEVLELRLKNRKNHFFDGKLLKSQLDTFETPVDDELLDTMLVNIDQDDSVPVAEITTGIVNWILQ
ncbi:hypothetical protein HK098_002393 [Nowakowskiella sp. JEL0407]|nr:hypothetical protein HK098_002393 [Nowakowskiella sp. JEL0407]